MQLISVFACIGLIGVMLKRHCLLRLKKVRVSFGVRVETVQYNHLVIAFMKTSILSLFNLSLYQAKNIFLWVQKSAQ